MIIDVRTMGILSALIPLVLGLLMGVYWRQRKVYGGYGRWVLANLIFSVGFTLFSLRGLVPDFISIILANVLVVYGQVLIHEGIEAFYGRRPFRRSNYLVLAAYIIAQWFFTYIQPDINLRIVVTSLVYCILILRSGLSLLSFSIPQLKGTSRSAGLIFLATALFPFTRAIHALVQTQPINMLTDPLNSWYSLVVATALLVWTFYFFLLNSARLELDLESARLELVHIASTDPLTGLYNRRHFFEHAGIEFQRARRYGGNLSLLLLDADRFKLINDNYGHDAGDAILLHIGAIFRRELRSFDVVARFGGDEFVVMLVGADAESALLIAERIRETVQGAPVALDSQTIHIQLSVGLASYEPGDEDLMAIMKRADIALYHAKKQGRNLVRVA